MTKWLQKCNIINVLQIIIKNDKWNTINIFILKKINPTWQRCLSWQVVRNIFIFFANFNITWQRCLQYHHLLHKYVIFGEKKNALPSFDIQINFFLYVRITLMYI